MVFEAKNRFWEQRSSHGRKPIFESPEKLWAACVEYFEWVESNPLKEQKAFQYQGEVIKANIDKMRAMTITSLCTFLDITFQTWQNYKRYDNATGGDFFDIITRVESIIRDQKFHGAAANLLNANLISRDLGLMERREIKQESPGSQLDHLTEEEIERQLEKKYEEYQRSKAD